MLHATEKLRTCKTRVRTTVKQGNKVETFQRIRVTREKTRSTVRIKKPQGIVLYRGPSLLNQTPIVCVATNLARKSKNPKTGRMVVQTYILADNGENPVEAWRSGGDDAICGDCPHRGSTCYVNIVQAPLAVYRAVQRGTYADFDADKHLQFFAGRFVRLGSYGDPAAVPLEIWAAICGVAGHHTGYTHQWQICDSGYAAYCMASVETPAQRLEALAKGYRTFRVRLPNQRVEKGEFICPASVEAGKRLTCSECRACSGAKSGGRNATPVILFHGSSIAGNRTLRLYERAMAHIQAEESGRGRVPLVMAMAR